MKRLTFIFILLLNIFAYTQVNNITVRVQWNPNPAVDNVTSYTLVVDGGSPISVLPSACTPTVCEQTVTVTFASHTFAITATNQWGTSPTTTVTENLSIPNAPTNVRITR